VSTVSPIGGENDVKVFHTLDQVQKVFYGSDMNL
jgi:hypothetical protein